MKEEIVDQRSGLPFKPGIKQIWIENHIDGKCVEMLRMLGVGSNLLLLADSFSFAACGEKVAQELKKAFRISECILDGHARPDAGSLEKITPLCQEVDAIIALGSGTINDLAKYSAFQHKKPYVIIATAPSMNGYTSKNASILLHGHKKSLAAAPPLGIIVDLSILAKAPKRAILAGLGDSLARSTAQVDWLLSHLILGTEYLHQPFDWLLPIEEELFSNINALIAGDLSAHRLLIENLLISGLGMNFAGGSYPASQGEHLLAHYMEMKGVSEDSYHGEHIALTTRTMAFLHDRILQGPAPILQKKEVGSDFLISLFGEETGQECWREFQEKKALLRPMDQINDRLAKDWQNIVTMVTPYHRPHDKIKELIQQMGGVLRPADIDWPRELYLSALQEAHYLRNRFTALDIISLTGSYKNIVAGLDL